MFGLWGRGGWVGASFATPSDAASWGAGAVPQVQLAYTGAATNGWVCSGKALTSTAWSAARIVTASDASFDGFAVGDLYFGVVAQVRGGGIDLNVGLRRRGVTPAFPLDVFRGLTSMRCAGIWRPSDYEGPGLLRQPQLYYCGAEARGCRA